MNGNGNVLKKLIYFPTFWFNEKERLEERIKFLEEKNRKLEQIIESK